MEMKWGKYVKYAQLRAVISCYNLLWSNYSLCITKLFKVDVVLVIIYLITAKYFFINPTGIRGERGLLICASDFETKKVTIKTFNRLNYAWLHDLDVNFLFFIHYFQHCSKLSYSGRLDTFLLEIFLWVNFSL